MSGDGSSGRYISKWERLPSALERVMRAGIAEDDAKPGICKAIADRAIEIQLALQKHATRHMTARGKVLVGKDVEIPARLEPQDLDFENSRPHKPWVVKRERIPQLAGYWHVDWIEVSRADITRVLIPAGIIDQPPAAIGSRERSPQRRRKSQTERERAGRAIKMLYPNDVPDQATESNKNLIKRVNDKLKELGLKGALDDTILRAAGRRRK